VAGSAVDHVIVTDSTEKKSLMCLITCCPCKGLANLKKTCQISCKCGQQQILKHTVDKCATTKFEGRLQSLREMNYNSCNCRENSAQQVK